MFLLFISEFEATQDSSRDTRMQIIKNKIVQLAKYFGTNDKFFPLCKFPNKNLVKHLLLVYSYCRMWLCFTVFIVKDLELLSMENEFSSNWAYMMMLEAQINPGQLLYTYDNLFKAKVSLSGLFSFAFITFPVYQYVTDYHVILLMSVFN